MRKLPQAALAVAALLAVAAANRPHSMDVTLANGTVAHIYYVGQIAPRVVLAEQASARSLTDLVLAPVYAVADLAKDQITSALSDSASIVIDAIDFR